MPNDTTEVSRQHKAVELFVYIYNKSQSVVVVLFHMKKIQIASHKC